MRHKRAAAAEVRAAAKTQAAAAEQGQVNDVIPWLRQLGFSARESREAAALCSDMACAPLEERVRVALSYFHLRGTRQVRAGAGFETSASLASAEAVGTDP